ncbi:MAG: hypothetical protein FJ253_09625, partial [Phycisphaerae bacterium]|nr:hypothetical protein [Phycisphaerae bacterium]
MMLSRAFSSSLVAAALLAVGSHAWSQGCESAVEIPTGDTPFDTAGATEVLDLSGFCDPGPAGNDSIYHTIWFKWVAPTTETYEVSTCNQANFDTRLAVLQASCDESLTVACGDDTAGCAGLTTRITFVAVEGTTYYIAVGGYQASTP